MGRMAARRPVPLIWSPTQVPAGAATFQVPSAMANFPVSVQLRCNNPVAAPAGQPRNQGFSLVEMVVALAIGALLLVLALPSYRRWIGDELVMNQAVLLAKSMQLARSEAIKRGHRVNLCKSSDGLQCADLGSWDRGFLMHEDTGVKGEVDGGDAVLRFEPPTSGIQVSSNKPLADYVSFTSFGHARMLNGALQMGTFTVCKSGFHAVDVVLIGSGRVRIARTKVICP
jgi:type IV fimbrial biogenesis protein FimT